MDRRAFLRTSASATTLLLAAPAWYAARSEVPEAEILSQARDGIAMHRQSYGRILVRDLSGKPMPGVKITAQQLRHDFLFGCNCFLFGRCGDADTEEEYRAHFAALFNYATLGFYWDSYERERGKPDYDYTQGVTGWAQKQAITCKGHPLVWDAPSGSPRWLPDDFKEIERLSRRRVEEIVSRFKGRIDIWDVVNEPTHLRDKFNRTKMAAAAEVDGTEAYVGDHLEIARAANPSATLLVNDYRTDPAYYKILEQERSGEKLLFDVIGIQSHMHEGVWPRKKVEEICDRYHRLGRPIHFTETTILSSPPKTSSKDWPPATAASETTQAEQTVKFYTTLFARPSVQAITWWDLSDFHAWQQAPAGLLRADMSPKPAYERLLQRIQGEWWTRTEGTTDAQGRCDIRAFFGRHKITCTAAGFPPFETDVHWRRDEKNHFAILLRKQPG